MADEAEDVLDLEEQDAIEEQEDAAAEPEVEAEPETEGDDESETFIGFEGEEEDEAAPASGSESSVIREMRRKLREAERELKAARAGQAQPAKVEIGPKPTLESCEYDEERFEAELDNWKARKSKVEAQEREAAEAEERQQAEWQETVKVYKAATAQLGVAGYEEAEAEVFSVLPEPVQALILRQKATAPALVYALARSPSKLEELSKLNLADAAVMVGELKAKVKVEKRPKLPSPDRPVTGRASNAAANLEALRAKARKSGNWDEYFAAKRAVGA